MGSGYLPLTKKAMKRTCDKFAVTGSHSRWPSIRKGMIIPYVPDISEPRREMSITYQPEGTIRCGITAFIPTASQNTFAELTGTVCLALNAEEKKKCKGGDKREDICL